MSCERCGDNFCSCTRFQISCPGGGWKTTIDDLTVKSAVKRAVEMYEDLELLEDPIQVKVVSNTGGKYLFWVEAKKKYELEVWS